MMNEADVSSNANQTAEGLVDISDYINNQGTCSDKVRIPQVLVEVEAVMFAALSG